MLCLFFFFLHCHKWASQLSLHYQTTGHNTVTFSIAAWCGSIYAWDDFCFLISFLESFIIFFIKYYLSYCCLSNLSPICRRFHFHSSEPFQGEKEKRIFRLSKAVEKKKKEKNPTKQTTPPPTHTKKPPTCHGASKTYSLETMDVRTQARNWVHKSQEERGDALSTVL